MGRRRTTRAPGRPNRLMEDKVYQGLVDRTRAGVPMNLAAASVGISDRTFTYWVQRGRDEEDRLAEAVVNGKPAEPDPGEARYLDLYRDISAARGDAAVRIMANVQKAAQGGFVTEKTVRTLRNGDVEETTKIAAPDWRAGAWYLEKSHRSLFGKDAVQVELTGAGGGAVQVGVTGDAEQLAARVAANIAALTAEVAPAQITDGAEVTDAEVIPD